jgi:hypothetical protein
LTPAPSVAGIPVTVLAMWRMWKSSEKWVGSRCRGLRLVADPPHGRPRDYGRDRGFDQARREVEPPDFNCSGPRRMER